MESPWLWGEGHLLINHTVFKNLPAVDSGMCTLPVFDIWEIILNQEGMEGS